MHAITGQCLLTHSDVTKDVKATLSEKISEIGGVLGLYNGFSVITLVEFLYFLVQALLILMQGIERRFLIGQRMKDWIQFRWEVLRQRQQNLMVKKDKKTGKDGLVLVEAGLAPHGPFHLDFSSCWSKG